MEKVILRKIEELKEAEVPNNKEVGYIKLGKFLKEPKVGLPFYMETINGELWKTSSITEIISPDTFKTRNSIYKIQPLDEDIWQRLKGN